MHIRLQKLNSHIFIHNSDILFNKFDGKVDLSVPPFDHLTSAPLYKKDVKFKIEWTYIRDELVRIKTFINSNLRSTIEY